jgi:phosphohistidine swiveling domain-containing protein
VDPVEQLIVGIRTELLLTEGSAEVVRTLWTEIRGGLAGLGDAALAERVLGSLVPLLATRTGPAAHALADLIAAEARASRAPGEVVLVLLGALDEGVRDRVAALAAELAGNGSLVVDLALVERVARADESSPFSAAALLHLDEVVRHLGTGEPSSDPVLSLLRGGRSRVVRRLAARLLDAAGSRPSPALARDLLGDPAIDLLAPYLEYSGATHLDVLDLVPQDGGGVACLEGLRAAQQSLGPALLREVIGQLGWSRFSGGFSCQARTGVSIEGSFPFVVSPGHARLLQNALGVEPAWQRHLVMAHGSTPGEGTEQAYDETVRRFRGYNVAHAELLDEILAVEPVDAAKARRILALLGRVVTDFAILFAATSEDAGRVAGVLERIARLVEGDLARDRPSGVLSGETVRRIQMFEDPQRLDEVTTLHGLKRYLHQLGLRLAFQLFRSHGGANHTVDLLVTDERQVLRREQVLRYLEFEPTPPVGTARLPFLVSVLADAFGRQLLHGRKLPSVTVLGYGNEFQIYVRYRNHPAFVRIDLSPPFRGGMIDLEYYAVSQYEMDQHPDLTLQGIQRVLRGLDFDVSKEGLRLRARYDKERAVDLGDIVRKAGVLFDLLPYLMDVDWLIGDLDYPEGTRAEVASAWAGFFARWGVVPAPEALSASRRKILVAIEPDPAGAREIAWNGRGAYRDRFSGVPTAALAERLRADLERRGLASLVAVVPPPREGWGQRWLDQTLLLPLAEAARRGEVRDGGGGIEAAPGDVFRREHEASRLAEALAEGGAPLRAAVAMAGLARSIERQGRFQTTGSIQGYAVQAANLPTAPSPIGLFVLRDGQGIVRLALAASGGVLYQDRPDRDAPWARGPELDAEGLARALRAYNYLGAGPDRAPLGTDQDLEIVRHGFASPHVNPVARLRPDERVVPATVAAPGRATGFAVFHTAGRQPAELDGCVLVSPAIRPEDVPWIRHAAGIVSTGGGILSHVGLVALELAKPAVIVEGTWSHAPSGAEVLLYRRAQWREGERTEGCYQVICRLDLRHSEEVLHQGDLVVVDGESGALEVLGHDAQALSLHHDLHQLERSSAALATTGSDEQILACRGRLLRAAHQLERLLSRLERPALIRHAVRELLVLPGASASPEGRQARSRLLSVLLLDPACAKEARASASLRLRDLVARLAAAQRIVLADLPLLVNPAEAVLARLGVRRMHDALRDALALVRAHGMVLDDPGEPGDVDAAFRARLEEIGAMLLERVDACQVEVGTRWKLRHLLPRLEEVQRVLGPGRMGSAPPAALERLDAALEDGWARRLVFDQEAGGLELRPFVGGKGAFLGEIARILGSRAVPPWFSVADVAFQQVLATSAPPPVLDRLGLARTSSLEEAIARVMERPGWESRRQSAAIHELWQAMPLPDRLVELISTAYRALADPARPDPPVAIRSSACEEDSEVGNWAGEFDTFLFVVGQDALLDHLKLAWAGFWTERAIERRRTLGAPSLPRGGGIVVQRMVDARVSGVLHTVYAAAGQLREMVINVGLGLGEGIVSGTVDVDHVLVAKDGDRSGGDLRLRYRIGDKREQVVFDRERGTGTRREETRYHQRFRAALEYVELCDLVQAASRLEEALVQPLDIEFAFEGRDLFILQARPIPLFDGAWRETLARYPLHSPRVLETEAT